MKKQDRQGVRTAADLERKYDFGALGFGGSSEQVRQLTQTLSQFMASTNATINRLMEMVKCVEIIDTEGVYTLAVEYASLASSLENGAQVTLYRTMEDSTVRYYHCMGTAVRNEVEGLTFHYGYGTKAENVFVGEDESVVIE